MAKINNSSVIQKLIDELDLSPAKDVIPTEVADKILPVFQINSDVVEVQSPTATIVRSNNQITSATSTTYTTPATGKFYLTNVTLQASANDSGTQIAYVEVTIDGSTYNILYIGIKPITAGDTPAQDSMVLNLQNPILLDQGTNITLTATGSDIRAHGSIVGYTED